jgi:hypothetical protein
VAHRQRLELFDRGETAFGEPGTVAGRLEPAGAALDEPYSEPQLETLEALARDRRADT